jgi:hypothetical protein
MRMPRLTVRTARAEGLGDQSDAEGEASSLQHRSFLGSGRRHRSVAAPLFAVGTDIANASDSTPLKRCQIKSGRTIRHLWRPFVD